MSCKYFRWSWRWVQVNNWYSIFKVCSVHSICVLLAREKRKFGGNVWKRIMLSWCKGKIFPHSCILLGIHICFYSGSCKTLVFFIMPCNVMLCKWLMPKCPPTKIVAYCTSHQINQSSILIPRTGIFPRFMRNTTIYILLNVFKVRTYCLLLSST